MPHLPALSKFKVAVVERSSPDAITNLNVSAKLDKLCCIVEPPHHPRNVERSVMLFGPALSVNFRSMLDKYLDFVRTKVLRCND